MRKRPIIEMERLKKPRIPKLWDYEINDKTTHLFLDCFERGLKNRHIEWVVNPEFKFKHKVNWIDWSKVNAREIQP